MFKKIMFVCTLVVLPVSAVAATTHATMTRAVAAGIGPRLGFSSSPDQFIAGGQVVIGEVAPNLTFDPNLEIGVGEQRAHFLARRVVQRGQQAVALLGGRRLHHVDGVVGRQDAHPRAALLHRERQHDLRLLLGGKRKEEVLRLGGGQLSQRVHPVLGREQGPGVFELRQGETLFQRAGVGSHRDPPA